MRKRLIPALILSTFLYSVSANAQFVSTDQGYNDLVNLPGWRFSNQSDPIGDTNWFQGKPNIFAAQGGFVDSYIAANHRNTDLVNDDIPNTICNYMIMPDVGELESFTFFTRSRKADDNFSVYPDRLYVQLSPSGETAPGNCTEDFGDFSETLLVINPDLTTIDGNAGDPTAGYPLDNWVVYTVEVPSDGRIAFVYYVEDAGFYGTNSNFIGIDTVRWTPKEVDFDNIFSNGFE